MYKNTIKPAVLSFLILTFITGIIYPFFITVIAQALFPYQANGSLLYRNGTITGSSLIGQNFDDPKYLWGRISATMPPYNASNSTGSNIGPSNPALLDEINGRVKALQAADPYATAPIPVDLVTSSASGLDPHISLAAAEFQIPRIARARGLDETKVRNIIKQHSCGRFLGLLGEPVVHVLEVNLALDAKK
jgi:potassium-transporting ATPase KdpC subunit